MATKTIKTQIGLRRDTEANYELVKDTFTPIKGEICLVETATGVRMKVGDGTTTYGGLSYLDTEVLNQILALDANKQNKLTAGSNIIIDDNGVISATGAGGTGGGTTAHVINEDTLVFKNNGVENLSLMIEKTCVADDFSDLSFTYNEFTFLLNNPQAYVVLHYDNNNETVFSFALRQIKGVDVDQGIVAVPDMLNLYGGGKIGENPLNLLVRIEYADDETLTTTVQPVDIYETGVSNGSTGTGGVTYIEGTGINIANNIISIDDTYVASKTYVTDELAKVQTNLTQGDGINIENDVVSVDTSVIATQTYVNDQVSGKQDALTNGTGISLANNVVSVDTTVIATQDYVSGQVSGKQDTLTNGDGIKIENNIVSVDTSVMATQDYVSGQVGGKQDTLTSGTGISLVNNVISVDTTVIATKDDLQDLPTSSTPAPSLTAGTGIDITDNVVSVDNTIATQTYVNNQIAAQHQDLGSNLFTLTNSGQFTLVQQYAYQVGSLIFIHITFRPTKAPDATGMFTFGKLSKKPKHNHSCAIAAINESTGNTITEGVTIKTDGTITVHLTKSTASSNYLFDLCCCFCESN